MMLNLEPQSMVVVETLISVTYVPECIVRFLSCYFSCVFTVSMKSNKETFDKVVAYSNMAVIRKEM